jgi:DHA1 family multidrug resistance protein-like MFS transporter
LNTLSNHDAHLVRDILLLLAAMGLNSLPLGYKLVVLPIYLKQIGFSGEVIGAIVAVSSIANTIALIPFAIAADRYGRRHFAVWGFLSATLAYLLFAFTRDLPSLLLASAIGGVGLAGGFSSAVWTPAWTALLAEKTSHEKRTTAFAWAQGIWTVALTAGSAMSVLPDQFRVRLQLSYLPSNEYAFLILATFAVMSSLVVLPVPEKKRKPPQLKETTSQSIFRLKSLPQISKFSLTLGLVGFASGISVQLLALWFNKMYGVNETDLGPWFAAAEITSLVVVPVIPKLTRNLGTSLSVLLTQGLSAALLGSMILAPTYQLAGFVFIVRNFFMNISWPIQQSYLMGTVTPEERASASAITSTIWGIGSSIGPLMAGYLLSGATFVSISAPLLIGAGIYLTSAFAFYLLFRRIPPPEEAHT